jgi:hypothetical protein
LIKKKKESPAGRGARQISEHFQHFSLSRPPRILLGLGRGRALKTNNSKNLALEDVAIAKFLTENATHSSNVEGSEVSGLQSKTY